MCGLCPQQGEPPTAPIFGGIPVLNAPDVEGGTFAVATALPVVYTGASVPAKIIQARAVFANRLRMM